MIKVITLRMEGNLEDIGFQVDVDVGNEGYAPNTSFSGTLSPMPELAKALAAWQQDYHNWGIPTRIRPQAVVFTGLSHRTEACRASAQHLSDCFLRWLQSAEFLKLDTRLREVLQVDDTIRIMLRTKSESIRKLPWHLWELVDRYSRAEVVLSAISYETIKQQGKINSPPNRTVKILAILGDATGINITTDKQLLSGLPNTDLTFLVEPSRSDISDQLWDQAWDILFFAGHSQTEDGRGRIYINRDDSLTLHELKYGLRKAIKKGLELAIFNSCDGLGLAYELEQLSLPHLIVMREPVPDKVAQTFLTHFLPSFAEGNSLYEAVRESRERLQGMEDNFPCASWLPVVYQQPLRSGPTWDNFTAPVTSTPVTSAPVTSAPVTQQYSAASSPKSVPDPLSSPTPPYPQIPLAPAVSAKLSVPSSSSIPSFSMVERGVMVAIATIIVTSLVVGLCSLGVFQSAELNAYDHFMQLRPKPLPDERLLVITVAKADIDYQDEHNYQRREGWSLSDNALAEVLQTLGRHQPRVVGLDISHPYPFDASVTSALEQHHITMVVACVVGTSDTLSDDANPPDGFGGDTLGFADLLLDSDGAVRRQLPLMATGDPCKTSRSLDLQLVQQYLRQDKVGSLQKLPNGDRQLGTQRLNRLQHDTGGYQLAVNQTSGYQLLLNYHYADPLTMSLRDLLASPSAREKELRNAMRDRIVLIGSDQPQQDRHRTAVHKDVPGVVLHAHMVSHLLDIALGQKSQLWWWPQWAESAWIALWALIASSVVFLVRLPLKLGLSIFTIIMVLYVTCWITFMAHGWIPLVPTAAGVILAASTVAITIRSNILSRQR